MGLFGVAVNSYVLFAVRRNKTFGHAFGKICMSHTAANVGITGVFALLVGPITLFAPELHSTYLGHRCGQILIFFWNAAVLSHFLTALNRFICICWPFDYDLIFTKSRIQATIVIAWILAFCQVFPYFWESCTFGFTFESYSFRFAKGTCGFVIGTVLDYYFSICMVIIIGTIDFLTFWKIKNYKKKTANLSQSGHVNHKVVFRLFYQALIQGLVFGGELISFFTVSKFATGNIWLEFLSTSVAWIMVHTIDGIILIVVHQEIRQACYTMVIEDLAIGTTAT
ncbi:hypothetical protein L596_020678 [Steinernema carpocapsae]|uniref:7TM GPCR serpentine receptor class x (Srx) domain-containing protein n=1 Tax=Steinernema carpocapsae TaxID=34508 RepID=A0A4U5MU93_STECR|nr:hypothetical protein L596_020678 [Steinernema carpocapsae]